MTTIGTCLMFAERNITTEAKYRALRAAQWKKTGATPRLQTDPLRVGFDSGVYLGWCDACGVGIGVDPRWAWAGCVCGRFWETFDYPDGERLDRLDAILSLRPAGSINRAPLRWYSWQPSESLRDLIDQNVRRGWPIPPGARAWQ